MVELVELARSDFEAAAEAEVGRAPRAGRDDILTPYEVGMVTRAIAGDGVAGKETRRTR